MRAWIPVLANFDLEIFLPVHNEAESIEATIREIYNELSKKLSVGFIICEDGSRDNSKEILRTLAKELPLRLNLSDERRGYSRAVQDGIAMTESEFLLCLDSDGQCDPKDFWQFWEARNSADLTMGWRVNRRIPLSARSARVSSISSTSCSFARRLTTLVAPTF